MFLKSLITLLPLISVALALPSPQQATGSSISLPACAQGCVAALSGSSCDPSDIVCLCKQPGYLDGWESCVVSSCTSGTDIIQGLAEAFGACGAVGITATGTETSTVQAAFASATSAGGSAAQSQASQIQSSASVVATSIASIDNNRTSSSLSGVQSSLSSAASAASATLSSISARLGSSLSSASSSLSSQTSAAASHTGTANGASNGISINWLWSGITLSLGLVGGGLVLLI